MVQASVSPRSFDRSDLVGLLNNTDNGSVSVRIGTDLASLRFRKISAHFARTDFLHYLANRRGKAEGLFPRTFQEVVPKTLGGLGSHTRKA